MLARGTGNPQRAQCVHWMRLILLNDAGFMAVSPIALLAKLWLFQSRFCPAAEATAVLARLSALDCSI